jgi:hypothetical protein
MSISWNVSWARFAFVTARFVGRTGYVFATADGKPL